MYSILRPLLFLFEPETAHTIALNLAKFSFKNNLKNTAIDLSRDVMGITFPNPVGLAAGLDKDGDYIEALARLGFGFIEVGTVTPKPQAGNPKPRLFRLKADQAIINRMGFNNKGVEHLIRNVRQVRYDGVLGINIGKNLTTSIQDATQDYLYCLNKVYPYASYITINVSSPNTPGLRDLQHGEMLENLFSELRKTQLKLSEEYKKYVPMVAKLAPDLSDEELKAIGASLDQLEVDGFIFSNTTNQRLNLQSTKLIKEQGGLSGQPLFKLSTKGLRTLRQVTDKPIIGVGGIASKLQAKEKVSAGANLVQVYSGLIYQGPKLINECLEAFL